MGCIFNGTPRSQRLRRMRSEKILFMPPLEPRERRDQGTQTYESGAHYTGPFMKTSTWEQKRDPSRSGSIPGSQFGTSASVLSMATSAHSHTSKAYLNVSFSAHCGLTLGQLDALSDGTEDRSCGDVEIPPMLSKADNGSSAKLHRSNLELYE